MFKEMADFYISEFLVLLQNKNIIRILECYQFSKISFEFYCIVLFKCKSIFNDNLILDLSIVVLITLLFIVNCMAVGFHIVPLMHLF